MTGFIIHVILIALAIAAVIRVIVWAEGNEARINRMVDDVLGPPTVTEREADDYWGNWGVDMPLSQTPTACDFRALIAEREVRQFRDELDDFGGVA